MSARTEAAKGKKTILVTGASSGIGRETALALAKQGHRVIMHGRNPEKTAQACAEIRERSGNPDVAHYVADLSLMAETAAFAERIKADYGRLDVLVNNAGAQFGSERRETAEGHEASLAINALSPFLLTNLLLPLLEQSPSARVVTVSSESYRQGGKPLLDDIELKRNYSLVRAYAQSKLFVWWLMRGFAERLRERGATNVTVNTVEPGSALTSLQRESGKGNPLMWLVLVLWLPFVRSARHGARTSVYMATSPEVEGVTGKFFGNCREKRINPKWIDPAGERAIWGFCEQACAEYLRS